MFKKILLTSITSLFALSAWSAVLTENLTVETDTTKTSTTYYNNVNFVGSEEDKTPSLSLDISYVNSVTVGAGIDANIYNYNTGFYVGCDSANSDNKSYLEDAVVSGAGMDSSSLTSRAWVLTSKNWGSHQALSFKDITLNMVHDKNYTTSTDKNNVLRGGTVNFTNARLNVLEASLPSRIATSGKDGFRAVNFYNSELNVNTGANLLIKKEGSFAGTSTVYFENSSATIDGTLNLSNELVLFLKNTSMTVNGSLAYLKGESAFDDATLNINASTNIGGNMSFRTTETSAKLSTINIAEGATYTISGATFNAGITAAFNGDGSLVATGTFNMSSNNLSVYFNVANMSVSNITINNSEASHVYIGTDGKNEYDVNGSMSSGVQANNGAITIKAKNATNIDFGGTGGFNLASINAKSHIGTNVTLSNVTFSRIINAFIDGKITTIGQQYTGNGWDYSFSLGCWSTTTARPKQIGNVVIGENAEINVLPTSFTNGTSTYFGMYGDITIKAQEGKLVSNEAAPLTIYGDNDTIIRLQSTDAFAVGGAATQAESTFNIFEGSKVKFEISADNNIGSIWMGSEASRLTLDILSGVLTLCEFAGSDDIANIILSDSIMKGSFRITEMSSILSDFENQSNLYFLDADGNRRELGVNLWIEQIGNSGIYNIYTQVPEPAEWAMIFGAIALGFVAYRRRK